MTEISGVSGVFGSRYAGPVDGLGEKKAAREEGILSILKAGAVKDTVELSDAAVKAVEPQGSDEAANIRGRIFYDIDVDHDGALTKKEYMAWVDAKKAEGFPEDHFKQMREIMEYMFNRAANAGGTDTVSKEDFVNIIGKHVNRYRSIMANFEAQPTTPQVITDTAVGSEAKPAEDKKTADTTPSAVNGLTKRFFSAVDKDGTGAVSGDEFAAWLNGQRPGKITDRQFEHIKGIMDKLFNRASEGKGEIDQEKFASLLQKHAMRYHNFMTNYDALHNNSEGNNAFASILNKKNDDYITKDEFTKAINANNSNDGTVVNLKQQALSLFNEAVDATEKNGLLDLAQPLGSISPRQYQFHLLTKSLFDDVGGAEA